MTDKNPEIIATAEAESPDAPAEHGGPSIDYRVVLKIQTPKMDEPLRLELTGWRIGDWLAPGAHADLDGSGLALWGDAQSGGWSVCDTDGCVSGRPRLNQMSVDMGVYDEPFGVDSGEGVGETVRIGPGDIPEWAKHCDRVDFAVYPRSAADLATDADIVIDAAEDYRRALARAIDEALEEMEPPDFPEPEPDEVYDDLRGSEIDELEAMPVRLGRWNCSAPLLVWRDAEGEHHLIYHPTPEDAGTVANDLSAALAEEIAGAIKSEASL